MKRAPIARCLLAGFMVSGVHYGHEKTCNYQEYATDHNCRIGDIEGRPAFQAKEAVEFEGQKVYDSFGPEDAVRNIADAATYDAPNGPALDACELIGPEHVDAQACKQSQGHHYEYGYPGHFRHTVSQAESGTGVFLVHEPEEVTEGGPGNAADWYESDYGQLGKLVCHYDDDA